MIRRIDLIPSSIKLAIALSYDLSALSMAFFLSYFLRLGGEVSTLGIDELFVFLITTAFTLLCFYLLV